MSDTTQQESIAVGWNVALVSLTLWTSIHPSGEEYLAAVKSMPLYDDGLPKVRGDGSIGDVGYATITWLAGFDSYAQYAYIRSTYCSYGRTGPVTIYTPLYGGLTYYRMNAVIEVPTPKQIQSDSVYWYKQVPITFHQLKVPVT